MKFTKMHGVGNDYIYFNCFEQTIDDPQELAIRLSNRRIGVGADGIVLIMPSEVADLRMRMFNADGSEGKMCGNASRCVGRYAYERGLTDKTELTMETMSGIKTLSLSVEDGKVRSVTVGMGAVSIRPKDIPAICDSDRMINFPINIKHTTRMVTCLSVGNPHCVTQCSDPDKLNLEEIGPLYENNPVFPERVNTEFVKIIDRHTIQMRVWERGSGETLACGTGACAAAAASVENGLCDPGDVTVRLKGGTLIVNYTDGIVTLTGPATFVYDGELLED